MTDDRRQPERVDVRFEYEGRPLSVTELQPGWRAEYGDRVVVAPLLDRALADVLGVPSGSILGLVRRILSPSESRNLPD